jgi:hypothetical protein
MCGYPENEPDFILWNDILTRTFKFVNFGKKNKI